MKSIISFPVILLLVCNALHGQDSNATKFSNDYFSEVFIVITATGQIQAGFRLDLEGYRDGIFTSLHGFLVGNPRTAKNQENFDFSPLLRVNEIRASRRQSQRKFNPVFSSSRGGLPVTSICLSHDLAFIRVPSEVLDQERKDTWKAMKAYPMESIEKVKANYQQYDQGIIVEFGSDQGHPYEYDVHDVEVFTQFKSKIDGVLQLKILQAGFPGRDAWVVSSEKNREKGSSGSPIFDLKSGKVIGIHSGSWRKFGEKVDEIAMGFVLDLPCLMPVDKLSDQEKRDLNKAAVLIRAIKRNFQSSPFCSKTNNRSWYMGNDGEIFEYYRSNHEKVIPSETQVKSKFVKSIPNALLDYASYRERNAELSLTLLEKKRKLPYELFREQGGELQNPAVFWWQRQKVKNCEKKFGGSISTQLFDAAYAYEQFLGSQTSKKSDLGLGNQPKEYLSTATQNLASIEEELNGMEYERFEGLTRKENRAWKKALRSHGMREKQPVEVIEEYARLLTHDVINADSAFHLWDSISTGFDSANNQGEMLGALRDLVEYGNPPNANEIMDFICEKDRFLIDQYEGAIKCGMERKEKGEFQAAWCCFMKAQQYFPWAHFPKQMLDEVEKMVEGAKWTHLREQIGFLHQELHHEFNPKGKRVPVISISPTNYVEVPPVGSSLVTTDLNFSFQFASGLKDHPELGMLYTDYKTGKYVHPAQENMVTFVDLYKTGVENIISEKFDLTNQDTLRLEGHADGQRYNGSLKFDPTDQDLAFIDNEVVNFCDPNFQVKKRLAFLFKGEKKAVEQVTFERLRKGDSDTKNLALAYLRAYKFAKDLQKQVEGINDIWICAQHNPEVGGWHRKVVVHYTVTVKSRPVEMAPCPELHGQENADD